MKNISHALAVSLIYEVSGDGQVAEYCHLNSITLTPVRFVHYDAMGELVALGDDVFSINPVITPHAVQLPLL
jgi:hypothetical protein